jgi:hypothetical protein
MRAWIVPWEAEMVDSVKLKPLKRITTPAALELAELLLMQLDLRDALDVLTPFAKAEWPVGLEHAKLVRMALWRDTIVQTMACFTTSANQRHKLDPEVVLGHINGWREIYQGFHDLRDAYAAHSFGALRQCEIMACINDAGEVPSVASIAHMALRPGAPSYEQAHLLFVLISAGLENLATRIEVKENEALLEARAMPEGELLSLSMPVVSPPTSGEVRQSRSAFRTKRDEARRKAASSQLDQKPSKPSDPG